MNRTKKIIPVQKIGSKTSSTSKLTTSTRHTALVLFTEAKLRLLDINNWYHLCGNKGAEFQLTDEEGNHLQATMPLIGNLIRIKLPAPPNQTGDGFDWVRIEEFVDTRNLLTDEDTLGFRVRPVQNPASRSSEGAHFYTSDATSSFLITRKICTVTVMERGRNEVPNATGNFLNKIRNIAVAVGAMIGLSKPQWKNLTDGILDPPSMIT